MINFLDVYERTLEGPVISEKEFNMKVFVPALRDVVNSYEISCDRENPVVSDDAAADNLYKAAVDFLSRVGVYCMSTNRIIHFTQEEIHEAVKEAPGKCYVGEGKDAGVYSVRKPDDRKIPWFHVGWSWICTSEEMATNQLEALASLPGANSLKIPVVNTLRGIPFSGGSPGEMYAAIRQVKIGREAARRAGRPGMPIMNCIGTASTAVTTIAASAPQFGLRPTDGWLVGIIAEMKVDYDIMNKIGYLLAWGANIGAESAPILGGYCGGPAGTAVVGVADILLGLLVHKGSYHLAFPMDFRHGCNSTR
ncbi:MAG: monomethylamine:corrinoid methyltransferase, partial [Proteobacteria bacterium]|nr:monomethylamine:corrinoid methyltransferase [Pseudomonadota bacterium]